MIYLDLITYILIGLSVITLIDTIGAIASRKMNFKYSYLSIASIATYILVAFLVSKNYKLPAVLFTSAVLGLYDGTVGFWFSIILRANNAQTTGQADQKPGVKSATIMVILSLIFGMIGYGLSNS